MPDEIKLLDVVALTADLPEHALRRGEIGTVVERYGDEAYEVEFVARDGYTYALVTVPEDQLVPLREKPTYDATELVRAMSQAGTAKR